MSDLLKRLNELCEVETGRSFREMTTLRIGGPVDYVCYPENDLALDGLIQLLKNENIPYKFLGKGSDLLCSDKPYHGAVIRLDRYLDEYYFVQDSILAQAGCSIISLAVNAMKQGLSGLEFASGIPGTIGGAIFMNAGAYKSSISDILTRVLVYKDGNFVWMSNEECMFGYRSSIFQSHRDWIILAAEFHMEYKSVDKISERMESRRERRMQSQPLDKPSCGSVFRNPEGQNAWALVEGIGYSGKCIGNAQVSEKHCNFIVNLGNARADDYLALVKEIQQKVKEEYHVELHTEMERFNWDEQ